MERKLIITVGRQIGSGGRVIARMLAEEFGCQFYDREILNLAAKESGFSEKFFEQNDEQKGFLKTHFWQTMISTRTIFLRKVFTSSRAMPSVRWPGQPHAVCSSEEQPITCCVTIPTR